MVRRLGRAVTGRRILVLGCEELMYVPLRLAVSLTEHLGADRRGMEVRCSATTRSPAIALDQPGYAIRTRITFSAHDDAAGPAVRFAYNIAPDERGAGGFDHIILIVEAVADTPALWAGSGLVQCLRRIASAVTVAVIPTARPGPSPGEPGPPCTNEDRRCVS
jgi:hypothetical protein